MPIIPMFSPKFWHISNKPDATGGGPIYSVHSTKLQIHFQISCNKEKQDVFL